MKRGQQLRQNGDLQKALQEFQGAGYEHVFVHQVGPDQEGFLEFYAKEVLPAVNATQRKPG